MLQVLVGDKNGRKFLGYVIGIALFIVLLPVIAIYGLFGWMGAGDVAEIVGYDAIYENLPTEVREQIDENEVQLHLIDSVFAENGLTEQDASQAKLIYLSYLTDRYSEENFYQRLADCFEIEEIRKCKTPLRSGDELDHLQLGSNEHDPPWYPLP